MTLTILDSDWLNQIFSELSEFDRLYFCSGYFNPPESISNEISKTKAELHLLGADARSNGFYKTKFPKSGITPAYQLFAQNMENKLENREYILEEWHRENVSYVLYFHVLYSDVSTYETKIVRKIPKKSHKLRNVSRKNKGPPCHATLSNL